jgi:predicted Rossmann fold nucleotide-binding protein DprA/Smf involved in DNA uptake
MSKSRIETVLTVRYVPLPPEKRAAWKHAARILIRAAREEQERKEALLLGKLLDIYKDEPMISASRAADLLGVPMQAIYDKLAELETAGRIRRNGQGVEIL